MVSIPRKSDEYKCDVIVDELFIQAVWIVLFTQTMPAIKFILSKCLCQIKSAVEGGVTNEDIIGVSVKGFFIQSSPDAFEDLP